MKIWYVLVLLLMVPVGLLFAAGEEVDIVYLKDGNVLRTFFDTLSPVAAQALKLLGVSLHHYGRRR